MWIKIKPGDHQGTTRESARNTDENVGQNDMDHKFESLVPIGVPVFDNHSQIELPETRSERSGQAGMAMIKQTCGWKVEERAGTPNLPGTWIGTHQGICQESQMGVGHGDHQWHQGTTNNHQRTTGIITRQGIITTTR